MLPIMEPSQCHLFVMYLEHLLHQNRPVAEAPDNQTAPRGLPRYDLGQYDLVGLAVGHRRRIHKACAADSRFRLTADGGGQVM